VTPASGPTPGEASSGLLDELEWRGILHATTPGLAARLATGRPISGYIGFDPSADSLHIGNLVPIFGLLRLQRFGGRPVALVGGGTGMIGDPSGRSSERNLLDRETLEWNATAIRSQLERFLDFSPGEGGAVMVNNLDWLGELSLIDFLRDTGKHFTIPYMLAKDSVQVRLERGLSYTEFSYMLLQAYDFAHLYRTMGVELQMGGAGGRVPRPLAIGTRQRRRPSRRTVLRTGCCCRRPVRSSARARSGTPSGSIRIARPRTRSTSTG
jgi:tyrosyl-tRNA synthetase